MGNQPFSTRFFCSSSSPIDHSRLAPTTPTSDEAMVSSIHSDPMMQAMPAKRNTIHGRVPQYYSVLMTSGWKRPMMRNVLTAMMSPVKYMSVNELCE